VFVRITRPTVVTLFLDMEGDTVRVCRRPVWPGAVFAVLACLDDYSSARFALMKLEGLGWVELAREAYERLSRDEPSLN
jgi:hypothetical protein